MTDKEKLEIIETGARKAGELILHAHHIISKEKTNARNVVTEYDVRVQEMLVDFFSERFPGAHFFCEESDSNDSLDAEHVFIIDPIDGTTNFVRGMKHSCVSIAYMSRGVVCVSAVYNPYLDEMFAAVKGEGAWLNGEKLEAENTPLAESVVVIGTSPYYDEVRERTFRVMRAVYDAGIDIRRLGSAALDLCSVAAGRNGLFIELILSFWDYAAGMLIAEEAGCVCENAEGEPLPLNGEKSSVVCGTRQAVKDYEALGC